MASVMATVRGTAADMASSWETAAAAAERMSHVADRMGGGIAPGGAAPADTGLSPAIAPPGDGGYNPGGFTMPGYRDPNLLALSGPNGPYPPPPGQASGHPANMSPWDYIIAGGVVSGAAKGSLSDIFNQAADVQHPEYLMMNMGASQSDAQFALSAAQQLQQKYPGMSWENAMTIIKDAYGVAGGPGGKRSMPEAIAMSDQLAQAAYVLQSTGHDDAAENMFSMARAGELRGLLNNKNPDGSTNLAPFTAYIDAYTRVAEATGGRVSPQDALTILKNAGPEGLMMDPDAMEDALILSQSMGAPAVGTGLNALAVQFLGGKMSQGAAQNLHRAGLLPDYMFDKDGRILKKYKNGVGNVMLPNGALTDESEFQHNPFEWVQDVFDPAVSKLDPGSQTSLLNSIYADASRTTAGRLMAETLFQKGFLQNQIGYVAGTPEPGQAATNLQNDPRNIAAGTLNAFDAFLAQIGSDAMPTATSQLRALTGALNGLTDWAKDHPQVGTDIFRGGEAVTVAGVGAGLFGVYKLVTKWLGGGAKGGADAAFSDSSAVAGEDALELTGVAGSSIATKFLGPAGLAAAFAEQVAEMLGVPLPFTKAAAGKNPITGGKVGPAGTKTDPLHVVVAAGGITNNMPTGQTGHNPTQSMPMPGHVN